MTFQAPLNRKISPVCSMNLTRTVKTVAGAIAVITLSTACATHQQPDATLADDGYWQQMKNTEIQEAVGKSLENNVAIDPALSASAPGMRTMGMSQRKRALRALAESSVRKDNPGNYTVVRGDTLWDISERFLSRPWLWPEIWHVNPQIENPHLIYPGDRIALTYVDGRPQLKLIRAASKGNAPISNFPLGPLAQFLIEPKVISGSDLKAAPYVVSAEDDRLIASIGNHIYARGDLSGNRYSIYRPGDALIDPDTNELLGHEAVHVSKASVVTKGDPTKLIITSNNRETLVGDRLMRSEAKPAMNFTPNVPNITRNGKIISLFDAVGSAGQNQVVVLNLGTEDGVQQGDVLTVKGNDRKIRDVVSGKKNDWVTIAGENAGVVMVFSTFDRVSYALIMKSHRTINLYDNVGTEL